MKCTCKDGDTAAESASHVDMLFFSVALSEFSFCHDEIEKSSVPTHKIVFMSLKHSISGHMLLVFTSFGE